MDPIPNTLYADVEFALGLSDSDSESNHNTEEDHPITFTPSRVHLSKKSCAVLQVIYSSHYVIIY